ncbi:hypothetical protein [Microbacterium sp. YY-01]|uniref:hypothetical protein n=1 Tax=Microbacterium sp. YY-01 TaxID=3421634 RepID=UPI003D16C5CA
MHRNYCAPTKERAVRAALTLFLALPALVLTVGCAPTKSATPEPVPTDTANAADDRETQDSTPTPQAQEVDTTECVVGTWLFSHDEMQAYYDSIAPEGSTITVDGSTTLSFTESEYEFQPDFSLTIDFGMEATATVTGAIGGTYIGLDVQVTTEQEYNDLQLDGEVMGQKVDLTEQAAAYMEMYRLVDIPWECSGDTLTLYYLTADNTTFPAQLTRM